MADTLRIGAEGERAAMEYLRDHNHLVVERNWRTPPHEIDIVTLTPEGHYHFVEVKTRHEGSLTTPAEALSRKKIANLIKAANHYVELHAITTEVWLDFMAVVECHDGSYQIEFIPDVANAHW